MVAAFFLFSMSCLSAPVFQDTVKFSFPVFGLESEVDNQIQNAPGLSKFYEKLTRLKDGEQQVVNIVHIGDSHIQADYLTRIVRRNFQQEFGNAGRGLIVPARVAGTNEPANFQTTSPIDWKAKRCIYLNDPMPIGIGGITIYSEDTTASFRLHVNDLWMNYDFNSVRLFLDPLNSFDFLATDTALAPLGRFSTPKLTRAGAEADAEEEMSADLQLEKMMNAIVIHAKQSLPTQNNATIFGLSLTNGQPGVLYHAIGVNGAKYAHYNAAKYFHKQTKSLQPDLFIISLGTNESLDYPYLDKNFSAHVDQMVSRLKAENPESAFLIITPPNSYRKKNKSNPGIQLIRQELLNYAVENGLPFYDTFRALGGEAANESWKNAGWLRPDGVHFTKEGYEHQGNLLYYALIKSYNDHVRHRHP